MTTALAYRRCESITRVRARNFYYGIRLLPPQKRSAMCAVYAFARRVDDIGDGSLTTDEKRLALAAARASLDALDERASDPVLVALADARQRFDLPVHRLLDLIAGVEMDVVATRYGSFDDLVVYCRRVAGSIGRLCLAIFGTTDANAAPGLSDDLGVALQLTNILRDVREDLDRDRIYLPADDLERFHCEPLEAADQAAFAALVRFEAARADAWFERGLGLLEHLDRRSAACVATMSGIYRQILRRIDREPTRVLHARASLPPWEKAAVAAHSLAPLRRSAPARAAGQG